MTGGVSVRVYTDEELLDVVTTWRAMDVIQHREFERMRQRIDDRVYVYPTNVRAQGGVCSFGQAPNHTEYADFFQHRFSPALLFF